MTVTWDRTCDELHLQWEEHGVDLTPTEPKPRLGLNLIRLVTERQLGGKFILDWNSDGLYATMAIPIGAKERWSAGPS